MEEKDRKQVLEMMRVFYASPAVWSNGSEEIFEADFAACISDSPFLEGYIFENAQDIQGYAMVAKSFSTEFGKPCIWIEDLYLQPEYRGKGIGRSFFSFLETQYPGWAFRLESEPENEPAVHLYRSCGFKDFPYMELIKGGL